MSSHHRDHPVVTPASFREAMGHLATGVTVVTAHARQGPVGMAANSVTSVSLDPPLILLCPGKSSSTWPAIRAAGRWCVNVMARHHEQVTRRFAERGADRFAGVACADRASGPALADAVAWIDCSYREEHDAGDHTIVVADVMAVQAVAGVDPLIFFRGRYGTLAGGSLDTATPI